MTKSVGEKDDTNNTVFSQFLNFLTSEFSGVRPRSILSWLCREMKYRARRAATLGEPLFTGELEILI